MSKFKILKKFVDNELIDNPKKGNPGQPDKTRKAYEPGDKIDLDNKMKIHRMMVFGIIEPTKKPKKRGRKKKIETTALINPGKEKAVTQ